MKAKLYNVRLLNEHGAPTHRRVRAVGISEAIIEAWALYRDLLDRDNEEAPRWTKALVREVSTR
jgi:hypothetical protein